MALPAAFFFNDTATTEIYTLSLHDALPISARCVARHPPWRMVPLRLEASGRNGTIRRSEEHTSELQSHLNLVCRLLLEKNTSFGERCCPLRTPRPPGPAGARARPLR